MQSYWITIVLVLVGCGVFVGNPSDDGTTSSYIPEDSTGGTSTTSVSISSDSSATLQGPSSVITLSNGLSVRYAKLIIGRLRMDATEEDSSFEKEIDNRVTQIESNESDEKGGLRTNAQERLDSIESDFDSRISEAGEEEQDNFRDQEDDDRFEVEKELAEVEKALEDEQDSYEEESDPSLKLKTTHTYDLMTKTVTPTIESFSAADGSYPRVEFELRPTREDTDKKLINRALVLEGQITIQGTRRQVEVQVREQLEVKLKASSDALKLDADSDTQLVLKFKLTDWFKNIDLSQAELGSRGDIQIDKTHNTAIYTQFLKNIRTSTFFGEDEDGDGDLSESEEKGFGEEA